MPTTPIPTAIVLSLQAAIQAIAGPPTYFNTIQASSVRVDGVALQTVGATEVPMVVIGHRIEAPQPRNFGRSRGLSLGAVLDVWRIHLACRVDASDVTDGLKQQALSQLEADLERAITVDPERHDVQTFSGGSIDQCLYTYVLQGARYMGFADERACYLEVPVDVHVQRSYGQP